jgi:hypothetical protein
VADESKDLDRIFNAVPNRIMFMGHYHKWWLTTPSRICDWRGDQSTTIADGRYFVVVGALCEGNYAIFDTDSSELVPYRTSG